MKVSLSELRTKLTSTLDMVKSGEEVTIVERGKNIAVIIPFPIQPNVDPGPIGTVLDVNTKNTIDRARKAQKAIDDILRGVNRKK